VLASVIFSFPFLVHPVQSGFQNLPAALTEAAYTLGKSRWQTFLRVLLPNIKPSLMAGIVLSFAHTIGEFGVVLMIGGNLPGKTRVASIAIYDEVESLNYDVANFYALVLFGVCFTILLTVYLLNRKLLMKVG
jgi:molybdate transport system permease protein